MGWTRYCIPGLVFQGVIVGAGYVTGRELAHFFMSESVATGLAGLVVAACVWSVVIAIAFEYARLWPSADYRTFLKSLVGPFWIAYEISFIALLLIVLSVLAAAAGQIVSVRLGWPALAGTLAMMAAVCGLVFFGTGVVERFLTIWSLVLYVLFTTILFVTLLERGSEAGQRIAEGDVGASALVQGVGYAVYNVAAVPGILYCVRHLRSRREALAAGAMAGVIAIVPGVLFFVAMSAFWPEIRDAPVPIDFVLAALDQPWLSALFYVVLFGVFVKTGAVLIHAVNERAAGQFADHGKEMPGFLRVGIAALAIAFSAFLAERIGIVALVAKGYTALSVAFLVVFVIPLVTIGPYRIFRAQHVCSAPTLNVSCPGDRDEP